VVINVTIPDLDTLVRAFRMTWEDPDEPVPDDPPEDPPEPQETVTDD
jgi:hypothetical protein